MLITSIQGQTRASDTKRAVLSVWDVPTRRGGAHMPNPRTITPDQLIHIMVPSNYN